MFRENIFVATHTIMFMSLPIIMSERYSFYLFENVEMTKDCFIKELHMVKVLQLIRHHLHYQAYELNPWKYKDNDSHPALVSNSKQCHYRNVKKRFVITLNLLYDRYHSREILIWSNFYSRYLKDAEP